MLQKGLPITAEEQLGSLVRKYEASHDADTQDEVTAARMTMGYAAANRGDMEAAREHFLQAEEQHAGTDGSSPGFGTLPDQAAYQAIVALQAGGKTNEAVKEYERYLTDRPSSPLIHAVHRRLKMLVPEDEMPKYDGMLQAAITQREQQQRADLAKCGPKAIVYLLKTLNMPATKEDEISKACGTDLTGTNMTGMVAGLKSVGLQGKGMLLNWDDFRKESKPLVWLYSSHYVVVLQVERGGSATIYDPLYGTQRQIAVPDARSGAFEARCILIDKN